MPINKMLLNIKESHLKSGKNGRIINLTDEELEQACIAFDKEKELGRREGHNDTMAKYGLAEREY